MKINKMTFVGSQPLRFTAVNSLLSALLILLAGETRAAVLSWSGGSPTTGNWSDSQNWGFVGTPANGDTLIFPAAQPRLANTNDIVGLTISQIRFVGAGGGYAIRGSSFTLTNDIAATNTAGVNTLFTAITLATGNRLINVGGGASLTLAGALSGSGGLTKIGSGTLTLSGSGNSFAGDTTLNEGILQLGSANVIRFGTLTIGDGWGGPGSDIVRFTGSFPIFGGPGGSTVIIRSSGLLDQNGFNDDVGPIEMDGGTIQTGAGILELFPPLTTYSTDPTNGSCTINGIFDLGNGSATFVITNDLTINASMVGGSSADILTKTGPGSLTLTASNSYAATTVVQQGYLRPQNSFALGGTTSGTIISNGASLAITGGIGFTNESLSLNGIGASGYGALDATGSTNIWAGPVSLTGSSTIWPFGGSAVLRIIGPIGGTGNLVKESGGILYLDGPTANTYTGTTTVNAGTLLLNKGAFDGSIPGNLIIGDGSGIDTVRYLDNNQIPNNTVITINQGGVFDVNGFFEGVGGFDMTGGTVQTGAGYVDLYAPATITTRASSVASTISGDLRLTGSVRTFDIANGTAAPDLLVSAVVRNGGIIKNGVGNLQMSAANTYAGLTTINDGFIIINDAAGLGTGAAGTVLNGGDLSLVGATVVAEPLTNNSASSILQASATSGWGTNVVLNAELQIQVLSAGAFDISGPISGTGALTKTVTGTLRFSGAQANTYSGTTTVETGTLELNKSSGIAAIPGNLVIGDGVGGANADVVRLLNTQQIANTADVQVTSSGLLDLTTKWDVIDELSGTGNVVFGVSGWIEVGAGNGSSTFAGIASGPGFAGGYTLLKLGTGTFTLTGNNTYLNQTRVDAGTLIVNGSQPQSTLYVQANAATAGGTGTVGDIQLQGNLAPGTSPGTLTSSNLFFNSAGDYFVELTGPTAGTQYDQLNVRGTNNLGNAVLHVAAAFTTPVGVGQQFIIINNDGSDAITGTFGGLAEGAAVTAGDYGFTISYAGGTGNDVVLTLASLPAAALGGLSTVTSGNGNGAIDPNECNYLSVVLTNQTATPMTGISATLASTTAGVIVTESPAPYSNVPGNSQGTNLVPFQISTTTNFVCGSDINLLLSVTTTSHGAFILPVLVRSGSPAAVPSRFDNNSITNVPDIGVIESTNTVAAWSGPLTKIAVSLWLVAPFSSDVTLSLVAPDGTSVELSSGNGTGANFGSGSADASRTTFDDAAAVSVTAGISPFVGTFRPEGSLASLLALNPVGNWRLRINDGFGSGSPDTLRAWSLFLYGADCPVGSGLCELCPNVTITSATGPSSPQQSGYVQFNGVPSSCGVPKVCPGAVGATPFPFGNHVFRNGPSSACVTVTLENNSPVQMLVTAYTNSFDPSAVCANYLADGGKIVNGGNPTQSFSFNLEADAVFTVSILGEFAVQVAPYRLTISGGDCRPVLNVSKLPGNQALLDWTTAAVGYELESTNTLATGGASVWPPVTNSAAVVNSRFQVTHDMPSTNQFYRLRKSVP